MKNKFRTFLVVSAGLVLTACGGGNGEGQETAASESSSEGQNVTVAVENASNPLSFTDETGELAGYEIDVLNAIDEQLTDYNFTIESVDAEATTLGLDTGKYEFIGGGLFKTEERQEKYAFPEENTGASIIQIYKRSDDDSIETLDDLSGKTLAPVTPNGGIFNLLTSYNEENPDNPIDFQLGDENFADSFKKVDEGTYDAIIIPTNLGGAKIIEQLNLNMTTVEEPVEVNPTYFVFAEEQEELINGFDEAIRALKEDGTLSDISNEWYDEDVFEYEVSE